MLDGTTWYCRHTAKLNQSCSFCSMYHCLLNQLLGPSSSGLLSCICKFQSKLNISYLAIGMSNVMELLLYPQNVLRIFLKHLFVPYVNSYLEKGFPLPIIKGFSIRDAYILTSYSKLIVSCDVTFIEPEALFPVQTHGRFIL